MKLKGNFGYLVLTIILVILLFLIFLFIIRAFNPREIDDVSPGIYCESEYIQKSEVLWVIPIFNNQSISKNKKWCEEIKSLNKTLGMHGVEHNFDEFSKPIDKEYMDMGINAFEECFGYRPKMFKAPQLDLSKENIKIITEEGMEIRGYINQWTHKVYHCSDTQPLPFNNKFNDVF